MEQDASSTLPRANPIGILTGIVIAFTAYDVSLSWFLYDGAPDWLGPVLAGAWVFQAHLFAIWAALGPGRFLLRLPPVGAAFWIVLGAPAVYPDGLYERREFMALFGTATSIFAITTVLLLIVRGFTGWQIERRPLQSQQVASRYQFNLRYLIVVTTIYAVVFAIYTNIVFKPSEPPAAFNIFGPDFVIHIIIYGGATAAGLLLPIIAVPLLFLSRHRPKRAVYVSLIAWAIITAAFSIFWEAVDEEGREFFLFSLLVQAGAAVMNFLAAMPLQLAGYRLEGRQAAESSPVSG